MKVFAILFQVGSHGFKFVCKKRPHPFLMGENSEMLKILKTKELIFTTLDTKHLWIKEIKCLKVDDIDLYQGGGDCRIGYTFRTFEILLL